MRSHDVSALFLQPLFDSCNSPWRDNVTAQAPILSNSYVLLIVNRMLTRKRLYKVSIVAAMCLYIGLPGMHLPTSYSDFRALNPSNQMEERDELDIKRSGATITEVSSSEGSSNRPRIYTFFEPISQHAKTTGMSEAADGRMLELWRRSWTDAGWDAQVLSLDVSRRHPLYNAYFSQLERVSLGPRPSYDRLCYLRWLAMAVAGGGFMADYDVFPLRGNATSEAAKNLPLDGKFIVYQMTERGNAVPSLASGSAAEWDRMARLLLGEGVKHESDAHRKRPKIWSDMKSLISVKDRGGYVVRDGVVKGQEVKLDAPVVSHEECQRLEKKWAVHISHVAVESLGQKYETRPELAKKWLELYSRRCVVPGRSANVQFADTGARIVTAQK